MSVPKKQVMLLNRFCCRFVLSKGSVWGAAMNIFNLKQPLKENLACDLQISKAVKFMLCDIHVKPSGFWKRKAAWACESDLSAWRSLTSSVNMCKSDWQTAAMRQEMPSNQTLANGSIIDGSCTGFPWPHLLMAETKEVLRRDSFLSCALLAKLLAYACGFVSAPSVRPCMFVR